MKILFIAPLPPPIHGQSLAAKVFLDYISLYHEVDVVDTCKKSHKDGINNLGRVFEVLKILVSVFKKQQKVDLIYFHVSESLGGNLKDLMIYLICLGKLNRTYIHLHGGSLKRLLFDKWALVKLINRYFISKLAGCIVLGPSHVQVFEGMIASERIKIAPNFAENLIFKDIEAVSNNFNTGNPIRVLYMSNLIPGKGYEYLLSAYLNSNEQIKKSIVIDFAGGFESDLDKQRFLDQIKPFDALQYYGVVSGVRKQTLFHQAQVFCLPTSYFEGQPISILEAYASGCVVVTTLKGGIVDIFEVEKNGFSIEEKSEDSIIKCLELLIQQRDQLHQIALTNRTIAEQNYKIDTYNKTLRSQLGL